MTGCYAIILCKTKTEALLRWLLLSLGNSEIVGSNPIWPLSFKETKCSFPLTRNKVFNILESLRYRLIACSASDPNSSNFKSCVWRTVSFHSSHHSLVSTNKKRKIKQMTPEPEFPNSEARLQAV